MQGLYDIGDSIPLFLTENQEENLKPLLVRSPGDSKARLVKARLHFSNKPVQNEEIYFRWTPHPVIVTIRDNSEYIRVLL